LRRAQQPGETAAIRCGACIRTLAGIAGVQERIRVDSRLIQRTFYSQCPRFPASDRAMIDVLACRAREAGRAGVESDEDIHAASGLDYWGRVLWTRAREFQQHGLLWRRTAFTQPPLLLLVAPSLRVHPAVDTALRYFSPEIEWIWRVGREMADGIKVVFRKSPAVSHIKAYGKRHEGSPRQKRELPFVFLVVSMFYS